MIATIPPVTRYLILSSKAVSIPGPKVPFLSAIQVTLEILKARKPIIAAR